MNMFMSRRMMLMFLFAMTVAFFLYTITDGV